jgi:hypothetical protein
MKLPVFPAEFRSDGGEFQILFVPLLRRDLRIFVHCGTNCFDEYRN